METTELTVEARRLDPLYRAFNARDIDAALAGMHVDVEWPNGMEGGYVDGHEGVRAYWTRQWTMIDPHVEPVRYSRDERGWIVLDVHTVVRDLAGAVIVDEMVRHAYLIEDGLVRRMEILPRPTEITGLNA